MADHKWSVVKLVEDVADTTDQTAQELKTGTEAPIKHTLDDPSEKIEKGAQLIEGVATPLKTLTDGLFSAVADTPVALADDGKYILDVAVDKTKEFADDLRDRTRDVVNHLQGTAHDMMLSLEQLGKILKPPRLGD